MDPVHDTRETFRAVMNAMSRPGTVQSVPTEPADHAVVAALVDHEVTFYSEDERLCDALTAAGRLTAAPISEADVVHATRGVDLREPTRGTRTDPHTGATVIYRTSDRSAPRPTTVELSGPGIDGRRTLDVCLSTAELASIQAAQADYPRGIDVLLTTDADVTALPRSVALEVV